jgi:hypothetical protein
VEPGKGPDSGTVTVRRIAGTRDFLREYRVYVDSELQGRIAEDESLDLLLPRGPHEIRLRIDWAASPALTVQVSEADQEVYCSSGSAGDFDIDFWRPRRYIQVGRRQDLPRMQAIATAPYRRGSILALVGITQIASVFVVKLMNPEAGLIKSGLLGLVGPLTAYLIAMAVRLRRRKMRGKRALASVFGPARGSRTPNTYRSPTEDLWNLALRLGEKRIHERDGPAYASPPVAPPPGGVSKRPSAKRRK